MSEYWMELSLRTAPEGEVTATLSWDVDSEEEGLRVISDMGRTVSGEDDS